MSPDTTPKITTLPTPCPAPGGGEYWPEDAEDHRDFAHGRDYNDQMVRRLASDAVERLRAAGWLAADTAAVGHESLVDAALTGPLSEARVVDVLEFGRIVHAEMSTICDAARRGVSVREATLYCTTYPCHMCARLIIASGIRRVVYIDPYAKSLVPEMYHDAIDETGDDPPRSDRVTFQSFVGVAPRFFPTVFSAVNRERDRRGVFKGWHAPTATPRIVHADSLTGADSQEAAVILALGERLYNAFGTNA